MLGLSLKSIGCGAAVLVVLSTAAAAGGANINISRKPTKGVSCADGNCGATEPKAVLNVNDLMTMLALGDVTLRAGDITVNAALSWTSTSRLTFDSAYSVAFHRPVVVAGTGALTITYNDGGTGGDYSFSGQGRVEFWDMNGSLIIAGNTYTLLRSTADFKRLVGQNPAGFYALARDYNAQKNGTYVHLLVPNLTGVIEGLGNTISNFTLQSKQAEVAFCAENHGMIRDIALTNASVTGKDGSIAGLVATNYGDIRNSFTSGQVTSIGPGGYMGGLVGDNKGSVSGSHSAATVNGRLGYNAGGLAGGSEFLASITTSYATGAVTGGYGTFGGGATGGLVGFNSGAISQSFATGMVSGIGESTQSGGLIGNSGGQVSNSYSTGAVSGLIAGGFVGLSGGNGIEITNSYSTGTVSGSVLQGGFAGQDIGKYIAGSYWDLDTSGISDPSQGAGNPSNDPGITGLTDTQLKSGLPSGFDPAIWGQSPAINNGYPYLLAVPPG